MSSDRATRAAKSQSLFREINERIKDLNVSFDAVTESGEWLCECADATCLERVTMAIDEYDAIRDKSTRFFVSPGDTHVWPDVELVIGRLERYWIVEKFGAAGALATQMDPRSESAPTAPH
jgi:hypothetical protein